MYKWTKKEKDIVIKYIEAAKKDYNMQSWSIISLFEDGDAQPKVNNRGENFLCSAECLPLPRYEKITIYWFAPILKEIRDENTTKS